MKKLPLLLLLICGFTLCNTGKSLGQTNKQANQHLKKPGLLLGAVVMYNSPRGDLANNYKGGVGGEVQGGLGWGKTYLVATLGYSRFISKAGSEDIIYKPKTIGLRQYIIGKNIFLNAYVGSANVREKSKDVSESHFTRGFGGGIRLAGLEVSLNYAGWKNTNNNNFSNSLQYKFGWNLTL